MLIPASLHRRVKTMQLIAAAVLMGLAVFVVIVTFLVQDQPPEAGRVPFVTYLGLFLLAAMVPLALLLPAVALRGPLEAALRQAVTIDEPLLARLLAIRQTQLILALAPLEAAGFFNGIAYLLERDALALGGALGALVVMATRFPTFASLSTWLDRQEQAIAARREGEIGR